MGRYRSHMTNRDIEEAERISKKIDNMMNLISGNVKDSSTYKIGRDITYESEPSKLKGARGTQTKEVDRDFRNYYRAKKTLSSEKGLKLAAELKGESRIEKGSIDEIVTNESLANSWSKNKMTTHDLQKVIKEVGRESIENTDGGKGYYEYKRYANLIGVGTLSKKDAETQFAKRYFNEKRTLDTEDVNKILHNNIAANVESNNKSRTVITNQTFLTEGSRKDALKDFHARSRAVDTYLEGFGINTRVIKKRDIDKMLKDGYITQKDGSRFLLDDKSFLQTMLKDKRNNLDLEKAARNAEHHSGGIKNTATAWVEEALQGTDAGEGLRTSKAMVNTLKASGKLLRFSAGGFLTIGAKGTEATSKIGLKAYGKAKDTDVKKYTDRISLSSDRVSRFSTTLTNADSRISSTVKSAGRASIKKIENSVTSKAKQLINDHADNKTVKGIKGAKARIDKAIARKRMVQTKVRNHKLTKVVRSPFSIIGGINRIFNSLKKKMLLAGATIFLGTVILIFPVTLISQTIDNMFSSGDTSISAEEKGRIGRELINSMRTQISSYLICIENEFNSHRDEDDFEYYHAEVTQYKGDKDDSYERLREANGNSPICTLKNGSTTAYSNFELFKAIIVMSTIKFQSNPERYEMYIKAYASDLLDNVLQRAEIDVQGHQINVIIRDSGLTNLMKLDDTKNWEADYAEFTSDYNVAVLNYEMSNEDWKRTGFDFYQNDLLTNLGSGLTASSGLSIFGLPMINKKYLTETEINKILAEAGVAQGTRKYNALYYGLTHLNMTYSQENRWGENSADCSSYVYKMFKHGGIDIGSTYAAGQCQVNQQYIVGKVNEMFDLEPGDLIFYADSTLSNGRYLGISHVSVYVGNGYQVDAGRDGTQYRPVWNYSSPNRELVVVRLPSFILNAPLEEEEG